MGRIDGDLDGDGTTTELLALESVDSLLLFGLIANINKAVTLALSGFTPPPSNDASGDDFDTRVSKEGRKSIVVDVEAEIGDKEDVLGWFANGVLAGGTRGALRSGFAVLGLVSGGIFCTISFGSVCSRGRGLSFCRFGLVTALRERSEMVKVRKGRTNGTHGGLLFLLRLLCLFGSRSDGGSIFSLVSYLTIRLGVGDFSGDRFWTSSARGPLPGLP